MMQKTQENLLELSQQGDPEAIAALISRSLQPKGIRTEAELDEDCLHLYLTANQAPNQTQLVPFIRNGIASLGVESIRTVRIYGLQKGQRQSVWQEAVDLGAAKPFSAATIHQRLSTLHQPVDSNGLNGFERSEYDTVLQQDLPIDGEVSDGEVSDGAVSDGAVRSGEVNGGNGATLVQPVGADDPELSVSRSGMGQRIAIAKNVLQ